jgi:hypothetical protein
MPSWPADLPQKPRANGYSQRPMVNVSAFSPEMGPPITRRKYTGASTLYTLVVNLEEDEVETFLSWFDQELQDGALAFTWSHWRDGSERSFKFSPEDPFRLEPADGDPRIERLSMNLIEFPR